MEIQGGQFSARTKIYFGPETSKMVGAEAVKVGITKAMIVTARGVFKAGLVKGVEESLNEKNIPAFGLDVCRLLDPRRVEQEAYDKSRERHDDRRPGRVQPAPSFPESLGWAPSSPLFFVRHVSEPEVDERGDAFRPHGVRHE